jgi:hypothetical protein
MTKQRFELNWLNLGLLAGVLGIAFGACTRVSTEDDGTPSTGNGGAGNVANTSSGLTTGTTTSSTARGGTTSTTTSGSTAKGGTTGSSTTTTSTGNTGNVTGCPGIPAVATDVTGTVAACNGASVEAEPLPVDMIILMDRSISNSYAVGSETATPAPTGQLRRWDVLTSAMSALATAPKAAQIGASITFFSINGGSNDSPNCDANQYATPVVPLALMPVAGPQIVAAMQALTPSGLTPTVPALTGAFRYAMSEKQKDATREKVLVMISDGFPTQCSLKSPSDVANVIKEAAAAPIPIRTFIIGIGSPNSLDAAKFNLQNYARAGNTGKLPYVLDETAGADGVRDQLVTTLLNISASSLACDYEVSPPSADWVVDPTHVMFTFQPNEGNLQEIPKVSSSAACARSPNGGWYFDSESTPTKITVCPCTCSNFGAGKATVVYGCVPNLVIE